jgi:hypothetical protein
MAGLGAAGAGAERRVGPRIEGVERFADRLVVAADLAGNGPGALAPSTREQNLAAAEDKGLGRAQAGLHLLALVVGQGTAEDG